MSSQVRCDQCGRVILFCVKSASNLLTQPTSEQSKIRKSACWSSISNLYRSWTIAESYQGKTNMQKFWKSLAETVGSRQISSVCPCVWCVRTGPRLCVTLVASLPRISFRINLPAAWHRLILIQTQLIKMSALDTKQNSLTSLTCPRTLYY